MEIAYIYDGTLDGLFTAIFTAYERGERPYVITEDGDLQVVFGQRIDHIATDGEKARRVEAGIRKTMGEAGYDAVWTAFLSGEKDRATKIYRFIRLGMKRGRAVLSHLSHADVLPILDMNKYTRNEAHLLTGFVRFSLMENGVYYAKITPNNNVLPIIMPHFADRYRDQALIIFDESHHLAGVYDLKEWYLVETEELTLPELAEGEKDWRTMWRHFYKTIGIKERVNHKLRVSHLPRRYWPNMTEFAFSADEIRGQNQKKALEQKRRELEEHDETGHL
jgi:probable DNA metabolism protein